MQPEKLPLSSMDITAAQREKLKQLFPEVFTEGGKIDFDRLKLTLGETVDTGKERYGMIWPGKADCFKIIQQPSVGTLLPVREESVNFDTTENLIIEGDNLEVLKLLQKSYLGKIKMIYIDPPYNTGNDFIYPDNYTESLDTYLRYTGQIDDEGRKFSTNTDADGRFHSKWLNMMYPRLFLAKNLLKDDGVIFISIDDHEVDNLKKICNEIFGEESFIAQFIWKSRTGGDARAVTGVSIDHEYILAYYKSSISPFKGIEKDLSKFSNPDNDPRGPWRSADMTGLATKDARPNLHYDLVNPETGIKYPCPEMGWAFSKDTMAQKIKEGRILWPQNSEGRPRHKLFLNETKSLFKAIPAIITDISTGDGTKELNEIFEGRIFPFPKPSLLIKLLIEQICSEEDIILDFFAGSCTIAHAVLNLNKEDNGNRRFICIQLPELCSEDSEASKNGYRTIIDIGKERVRRVIVKLNQEENGKLRLGGAETQDRGFKVFKLAPSNFKLWNSEPPKDGVELTKQLELHINHILPGRSQEDILTELLLKAGFPLTVKIERLTLAGKTVFSIAEGAMLICLEHGLTLELIKEMAVRKPQRVICLDEGFAGNDQLKTNAALIFEANGVLKFQTV